MPSIRIQVFFRQIFSDDVILLFQMILAPQLTDALLKWSSNVIIRATKQMIISGKR